MNYAQLVSISLLFLLVSMPVSFAASLTGYGFGQDELQGYSRGTDKITLIADVSGVSDVDASDVFYKPIGPRIPFDSCTGNRCSLVLGEQTFTSQPQNFLLELQGSDTHTAQIIPDSQPAKVVSVQADKQVLGPDEEITFTVEAQDSACSGPGCAGKCSGINTIGVYEGTQLLDEIGVFTSQCSSTSTETFTMSSLTGTTGDVVVTFKAVDAVMNPSDDFQSIVVHVDDQPPLPATSTYQLLVNDEDIGVYARPVSAVFSVEIADSFEIVTADLSSLNPSLGNALLSCNELVCSRSLTVSLGSGEGEEDVDVSITLQDEYGNEGTYELTKTILFDQQGPEIDEINVASAVVDDIPALGKDTFVQVIFEDVAGTEKAFLDATSLQRGTLQTTCLGNVCTFPSLEFVANGVFSLAVYGRDVVGNDGAKEPFQVYADSIVPTLLDIPVLGFEDIESSGSSRSSDRFSVSRGGTSDRTDEDVEGSIDRGGESFEEEVILPTKGDTLTIVATVTDNTAVAAYGDFSTISDEQFHVAECEGGVDVDDWILFNETDADYKDGELPGTCVWEVEVTKSGNIIDQEATLYFTDPSGNTLEEVITVPNVYGLINDAAPNFWTHNVTCTPNILDRKVGELIEQESFCVVSLHQLTEQQQVITGMELDDCDGEFLSDSVLGNAGTTQPYLHLTFDDDTFDVNSVNVSCVIEINTKLDYDIIVNPEREEVNVSFSLFNNPLDTPDEAAVSEIQNVIDTYVEGWGILETLNMIVRISSAICKTLDTIESVGNLAGMAGIANREPASGTAQRAATSKGILNLGTEFTQFAEKFCAFITCRAYTENGESKYLLAPWGSKMFETLDFGGIAAKHACQEGNRCATGDPAAYMDIKNNIYLSVATLCVPGIIHNLEKYRQIQCFYGYCLQDLAVENGLPATACAEQKAYQTCKFFVTPLFTAFPLVAFVNQWLQLIQQVLRDPISALRFVIGYACSSQAASPDAWGMCELVRIVDEALNVWSSIENIMEEFQGPEIDYCELLDDSPRSSSRIGGRS